VFVPLRVAAAGNRSILFMPLRVAARNRSRPEGTRPAMDVGGIPTLVDHASAASDGRWWLLPVGAYSYTRPTYTFTLPLFFWSFGSRFSFLTPDSYPLTRPFTSARSVGPNE
jgi:hypothetical protein